MAAVLKKVEWDNPSLALSPPSDLLLVKVLNQEITPWSEEHLQDAIDSILGPAYSQFQNERTLTSADTEEAYANYITDGVITLDDNPATNSVKSFLKSMQPYREKLFAAGNLPLDTESPESHDVTIFQYWTVFPSNKILCSAKVFLLGQVIYLSEMRF